MGLPSDATFFSEVFGLCVASNRSINGLPARAIARSDIVVRFGPLPSDPRKAIAPIASPDYVSPFHDEVGRPLAQGWLDAEGRKRIVTSSGAEALVGADGNDAWVNAPTLNHDLDGWVLGPIMAAILRTRGFVCLHASAVRSPRGVIAITGGQGVGKSSVAAVLAMRGWPVVTDDIAVLSEPGAGGACRVPPGAPYLRIRPGAIESVAATERCRLTPTPDRKYLDLHEQAGITFAPTAEPLVALFHLEAGAGAEQLVRGSDAVMTLAADTWMSRWLSARERAAEFDLLTRLVAAIPMRRLPAPEDVPSLLAAADAIAVNA